MKGLLLKDIYMMGKYCRYQLVMLVVAIGVSLFSDMSLFFLYYAGIVCAMIPVSLFAYDEKSRWLSYSGTLPYDRAQLVSAKYLIGLIVLCAMLVVAAVSHTVRAIIAGGSVTDANTASDLVALLRTMMWMSFLVAALTLPVVFKCGVEKGRVAYSIMIGLVAAASGAGGVLIMRAENFTALNPVVSAVAAWKYLPPHVITRIIDLVVIAVYLLSWRLSVAFYKKREM